MKLAFRIIITTFILFLYILCFPSLHDVFAQNTATSPCVITEIGTANPNASLPAGCSGGGNQDVIALAKQQLGKPYVWGAPSGRVWSKWDPKTNVPGSFDCSGLVGWSWYWGTGGKVSFPGATSATWGHVDTSKFQTFTPAQKAQIQPGDAIYWSTSTIHHTALYEGPGNCGAATCIIEAQQTGVPVKESSFEGRINGSDPWVGFIRPINF